MPTAIEETPLSPPAQDLARVGTHIAAAFRALAYFCASVFYILFLGALPRPIFHRLFGKIERKVREDRLKTMIPHIEGAETVLDVGSGSGKFGKILADRLGIKVTGVDVIDYSETEIPFHVYDGKSLPFADGSFDVVLAVFVLHHCTEQEPLFSELLRVAKKKVVIFEDSFELDWQRSFVQWHDFQTNIVQGSIKVFKKWTLSGIRGMPMPYTFRSIPGWRAFFEKFPVRIGSVTKSYACFKTLTRVIFSLNK